MHFQRKSGARRSGKTVFSHLLLRGKDAAFVNFDDERLAFLGKEALNDILNLIIRRGKSIVELIQVTMVSYPEIILQSVSVRV